MPHNRPRHALPLMQKRLSFWSALGILGARQVGKSTLLKSELVSLKAKTHYVTLDQKDLRDQAQKQPTWFLSQFGKDRLILDEVQKAPDLFDAIKQEIDTNKRPGRYILTGSVMFSQKVGIRESLTGRIGLMRLYPLTLAETLSQPFLTPFLTEPKKARATLADVQKRLVHGGMPGICFMRSAEERGQTFDAWLDTLCFRDLQQIKGQKLSGDIALDILKKLATISESTALGLKTALKKSSAIIQKHLDALESLFVIQKLNPHPLGVGKPRYYLFDSGLAHHLGASPSRQLEAWLLMECLAQHEYAGKKVAIKYYCSRKNSEINFVVEKEKSLKAYLISDEESVSTYTLRTAEAFLAKAPTTQVTILTPSLSPLKISPNIRVVPYHFMA